MLHGVQSRRRGNFEKLQFSSISSTFFSLFCTPMRVGGAEILHMMTLKSFHMEVGGVLRRSAGSTGPRKRVLVGSRTSSRASRRHVGTDLSEPALFISWNGKWALESNHARSGNRGKRFPLANHVFPFFLLCESSPQASVDHAGHRPAEIEATAVLLGGAAVPDTRCRRVGVHTV